MWSRFVFELVIWLQEVSLARWTQPSGPLCLWQCFFYRASGKTTGSPCWGSSASPTGGWKALSRMRTLHLLREPRWRWHLDDAFSTSYDLNHYSKVRGRDVGFQTTKEGEFWRILLPGIYTMEVFAEGFAPREVQFAIVEQNPTMLNVTLYPVR